MALTDSDKIRLVEDHCAASGQLIAARSSSTASFLTCCGLEQRPACNSNPGQGEQGKEHDEWSNN